MTVEPLRSRRLRAATPPAELLEALEARQPETLTRNEQHRLAALRAELLVDLRPPARATTPPPRPGRASTPRSG
jgi:hypothetical protein